MDNTSESELVKEIEALPVAGCCGAYVSRVERADVLALIRTHESAAAKGVDIESLTEKLAYNGEFTRWVRSERDVYQAAFAAIQFLRPHLPQQDRVEVTEEAVERMAKIIYDAMRWAAVTPSSYDVPPIWQEGGNSIAQDKARSTARAALQTETIAGEAV